MLVCPTIMEWVVLAYTFKLSAVQGKCVVIGVILTEIASVFSANHINIRQNQLRVREMVCSAGVFCICVPDAGNTGKPFDCVDRRIAATDQQGIGLSTHDLCTEK